MLNQNTEARLNAKLKVASRRLLRKPPTHEFMAVRDDFYSHDYSGAPTAKQNESRAEIAARDPKTLGKSAVRRRESAGRRDLRLRRRRCRLGRASAADLIAFDRAEIAHRVAFACIDNTHIG
jgi:hypothetical protein